MANPRTPASRAQRLRPMSIYISYTPEEVARLAKEARDRTIADVNLELFSCWIRQKWDNYEEAKKHIRELGLDLTYATSRIENEVVRTLVDDAHHFRSGYQYPSDEGEADESDGEGKKRSKTMGLAEFLKTDPDALSNKSSGPFKSSNVLKSSGALALDPKLKSRLIPRQSSSPLRPRSPWTTGKPPSLVSRSAGKAPSTTRSASILTRSTLSSNREYPPDTPDRPAPLRIRSRGADSAPAKTALRSFSTPLRPETPPRVADSPTTFVTAPARFARNAFAGDARPTSSVYSNDEELDHVGLSNELSGMHRSSNDTLPQQDFDRTQPHYELEPHELAESASNSPMAENDYPSSDFGGPAGSNTGSVFDDNGRKTSNAYPDSDFGGPAEPNSSSVFRTRIPETPEELMESLENDLMNMLGASDKQSNERASSPVASSDIQQRPSYTLAKSSPKSRLRTFASNPRATPAERRAAAAARRAARLPNFAAMASFHRPVPLRSYESEAFLFPTARAQGYLAHTRATSLDTSPSRGSRPLDIAGLHEYSRRVGPSNLRNHTSPSRHSRASSRASSRPESTGEVDLSQFPDVPSSTAPLDPESLGTAYKSVTEAYMKQSLSRTHARGALLPTITMRSLPSFERAWRNVNEQLLVAIYGRNDVELTDADVTFVDRIAKELSDGVGQIGGYEWVGALFQNTQR